MTIFFFKFKKPYISPIFGLIPLILGGKKCFPKKSGTDNLIRFSSTMPKFREI